MFTGSILQQKARRFVAKKRRVQAIVKATTSLPRLVVTRSLTHISAQVIARDGNVVAAVQDVGMKGTKSEKAFAVGKKIAELAQKAGVSEIVFDRSGYLYHGRIKQLAEGAREGGLKF